MKQLAVIAALVACTSLLASCGTTSNGGATPDHTAPEHGTRAAPDPADDFQPLAVNMVAQSDTWFPDGVEGITFGCSDTLVTINTVPVEATSQEDHVAAAIEFLLKDSQYYHGSPAVTNSLTLSETLELTSVDAGRNSVQIVLTGDVVAQGECEAYRIQAQMYGTAASTAGVDNVSISVDDVELNEVLGLEPLDTAQLFDED